MRVSGYYSLYKDQTIVVLQVQSQICEPSYQKKLKFGGGERVKSAQKNRKKTVKFG